MGLYFNNNGNLQMISGRGKAEYGASTVRTGTISLPSQTAHSTIEPITVTFSESMPDDDYQVSFDTFETTSVGYRVLYVKSKSASGFTVGGLNADAGSIPAGTINYTAFKLYTDLDYNSLIANATRIRNDITSRLDNLSQAIAEQDLGKYGYKIGDYFVGPSGYYYYLADMDTFYGGYASYAVVATHHVGVVVDTKATSAYLSSGTLSGYSTSTLHSYLKGTVLTNIKSDFTSLFGSWNDHLIPHTKLYNTVSSWAWSGTNDNTEYISALTEVQMYGCPIWSGNSYQQGEGDKHLELFKKYKYNEIYGNVSIWLRSIYSASYACCASNYGLAYANSLSAATRASGLILMK